MAKRILLLLLFFFGAVLVAGCRPKPPQITVLSGQITRIDAQGFELVLHVDAFNPNSYALSVRGIQAEVVLDKRIDLGTVTINKPVSIPAGQHVQMDVPVDSKWNDVLAIASLAASNRVVPYTVKGTVTLGGESVNVDVPYSFDGQITHEQLLKAATSSLPKNLPFKLP